jgi:glycogen operon protein
MSDSISTSGVKAGAFFDQAAQQLTFQVYSKNAQRIELWIFDKPEDATVITTLALTKNDASLWSVVAKPGKNKIPAKTNVIYYGYRVWGPNWIYDEKWRPGSLIGFMADCDNNGNRFNPNKLLLDPWAREISHDPAPRFSTIDPNEYSHEYYSGEYDRGTDTASFAPKSVLVLNSENVPIGIKPKRHIKDDIIYEVNVRGFTAQDSSIPSPYRGTYKGAALKAGYLRDLGVTAVEFLPVHHFASEQNDDNDPRGDNYWGYMTLGFFAPNRRYASNRSPGGPVREFKEMVRAFHEAGIKVFLDVVYNHTGEGLLYRSTEHDDSREDDYRQDPTKACILSFRGLDNATFYTLRTSYIDNGKKWQRYQDNSACGGSFNVTNDIVKEFIFDSLSYWANEMGVDGFRFDLAPVLGNRCASDVFEFNAQDPNGLLQRITRELPLRSGITLEGVDLIAEPWATGYGQTYQLGNFPDGWSEWNDIYRSALRQFENKLHVITTPPHRIANALAGSDQQFWYGSGRKEPHPYNSVNYICSHDGYNLRDLFSCTAMDNSWDHGGSRDEQRKAVRNVISLLFTSAGVPMFCGGDELFKTQDCLHNAVAVDSQTTHLQWDAYNNYQKNGSGERLPEELMIYTFFKGMLSLRNRFSSLRPGNYFTGLDIGGKGIKDITWYQRDGYELTLNDWNNGTFIGMRIDNLQYQVKGEVGSLFIAYNWNDQFVDVRIPENIKGMQWFRYADTANWFEFASNIDEQLTPLAHQYGMHARSVLVLIEK